MFMNESNLCHKYDKILNKTSLIRNTFVVSPELDRINIIMIKRSGAYRPCVSLGNALCQFVDAIRHICTGS